MCLRGMLPIPRWFRQGLLSLDKPGDVGARLSCYKEWEFVCWAISDIGTEMQSLDGDHPFSAQTFNLWPHNVRLTKTSKTFSMISI